MANKDERSLQSEGLELPTILSTMIEAYIDNHFTLQKRGTKAYTKKLPEIIRQAW